MSYVKQQLLPQERIIYETHLSTLSIVPWFLLFMLLLFSSAILFFMGKIEIFMASTIVCGGLVLMLKPIWIFYTTEIAITDLRVIGKVGVFARNTIDLELMNVELVEVNQSICGRLFNYGDVEVCAAGNKNAAIDFVHEPFSLRQSYHAIKQSKQIKGAA